MTDPSAVTPERPETPDSHHIFAHQYMPAALCIIACFALPWLPSFRATLAEAASRMTFQPGYLHAVYTGNSIRGASFALFTSHQTIEAAERSFLAILCAVGLALTSVFRRRAPQWLRLGSKLEHGMPALLGLQSGHPGDYVVWLTTGVAIFGVSVLLWLR